MSYNPDYDDPCNATIDLGASGYALCYLHRGHTGSHRHSEFNKAVKEAMELVPPPPWQPGRCANCTRLAIEAEAYRSALEEKIQEISRWAREGADNWSARAERRAYADPDGIPDAVCGWYSKLAARYELFASKLDAVVGPHYLNTKIAKAK